MNGYGYSLNSDIDTDINDDDTLSYYASKTTGFGKGIEFSDGNCNCSGILRVFLLGKGVGYLSVMG